MLRSARDELMGRKMTLEEWFAENFPHFVSGSAPLEPMWSVCQAAYTQGYEDGINHRADKTEGEE